MLKSFEIYMPPRNKGHESFLFEGQEGEFVECDSCRIKTGTPALCRGCCHNRELIDKLKKGKRK